MAAVWVVRAFDEVEDRDCGLGSRLESVTIEVTLNPKTGPAGLAKFRQNNSTPSGAIANAKTSYRRTDRSSPSPS